MAGNRASLRVLVNEDGTNDVISQTFAPDKVLGTKTTSPCSTKFDVQLNSPTVSSHDYTYRYADTYVDFNGYMRPKTSKQTRNETLYHPQSERGTRTQYSFEIDWAKVPGVEKTSNTSISILDRDGDKVEFFLQSKDYTTRLHYAMEFLRVKCDKKSATGF